MQTEFTCGIYTAKFITMPFNLNKWEVNVNNSMVTTIDEDGKLINFGYTRQYLTQDMLIELAVLMNNIKRQYKQLNRAKQPDQRGQGFDGIPDES